MVTHRWSQHAASEPDGIALHVMSDDLYLNGFGLKYQINISQNTHISHAYSLMKQQRLTAASTVEAKGSKAETFGTSVFCLTRKSKWSTKSLS